MNFNVEKIKAKCPKSWYKFIKWYAGWTVEQEGYIEELFDILFTIENMRSLYTFFDEKSKYTVLIGCFITETDDMEWVYSVFAKDTGLAMGDQGCSKTRIAAEIEAFNVAFAQMEKEYEA